MVFSLRRFFCSAGLLLFLIPGAEGGGSNACANDSWLTSEKHGGYLNSYALEHRINYLETSGVAKRLGQRLLEEQLVRRVDVPDSAGACVGSYFLIRAVKPGFGGKFDVGYLNGQIAVSYWSDGHLRADIDGGIEGEDRVPLLVCLPDEPKALFVISDDRCAKSEKGSHFMIDEVADHDYFDKYCGPGDEWSSGLAWGKLGLARMRSVRALNADVVANSDQLVELLKDRAVVELSESQMQQLTNEECNVRTYNESRDGRIYLSRAAPEEQRKERAYLIRNSGPCRYGIPVVWLDAAAGVAYASTHCRGHDTPIEFRPALICTDVVLKNAHVLYPRCKEKGPSEGRPSTLASDTAPQSPP